MGVVSSTSLGVGLRAELKHTGFTLVDARERVALESLGNDFPVFGCFPFALFAKEMVVL